MSKQKKMESACTPDDDTELTKVKMTLSLHSVINYLNVMLFESRFSSIFSLNLLNVSGTLVRIMSVMTVGIDPMDSDFADGVSSHGLGIFRTM